MGKWVPSVTLPYPPFQLTAPLTPSLLPQSIPFGLHPSIIFLVLIPASTFPKTTSPFQGGQRHPAASGPGAAFPAGSGLEAGSHPPPDPPAEQDLTRKRVDSQHGGMRRASPGWEAQAGAKGSRQPHRGGGRVRSPRPPCGCGFRAPGLAGSCQTCGRCCPSPSSAPWRRRRGRAGPRGLRSGLRGRAQPGGAAAAPATARAGWDQRTRDRSHPGRGGGGRGRCSPPARHGTARHRAGGRQGRPRQPRTPTPASAQPPQRLTKWRPVSWGLGPAPARLTTPPSPPQPRPLASPLSCPPSISR